METQQRPGAHSLCHTCRRTESSRMKVTRRAERRNSCNLLRLHGAAAAAAASLLKSCTARNNLLGMHSLGLGSITRTSRTIIVIIAVISAVDAKQAGLVFSSNVHAKAAGFSRMRCETLLYVQQVTCRRR